MHEQKTRTVHVTVEINWSDKTINKHRNSFAVYNACLAEVPVIKI